MKFMAEINECYVPTIHSLVRTQNCELVERKEKKLECEKLIPCLDMSSKTLTQNNEIITMENFVSEFKHWCSKFCLFNSNILLFDGLGSVYNVQYKEWKFHFHYDKRHLFIFEFGILFGFLSICMFSSYPESGIRNPESTSWKISLVAKNEQILI